MRGNGLELKQEMFGLGTRKKISSLKGGQALKQAVQGSDGITSPGSVQKVQMWHFVTWFDSGLGRAQLTGGLADLRRVFQP